MRHAATAISAVLTLCSVANISSAGELRSNRQLRYEPEIVILTGRLVQRTYPGPPNYEDVGKGDRPETAWILQLDEPVDVLAADNDELQRNEQGICEVQLVFIANAKARKAVRIGRRQEITGQLFSSITGHHHKDVLIAVKRVRHFQQKALPPTACKH